MVYVTLPIMKVTVDRGRCQGIGMCEAVAPDLFAVGPDAVARLEREPTDADSDAVDEAVESCPTQALAVEP